MNRRVVGALLWAALVTAILSGIDPGIDRADPRDIDLSPTGELTPEQRLHLRAIAADTLAVDSLLARLGAILDSARF